MTGKDNAVYIYSGMLFSLEKDVLLLVILWMDLEGFVLSEIGQTGKTNTV